MIPEKSPLIEKERVPFPELETKDLPNSIVFKLIPNGKFTEEQIQKIKDCNDNTIYHKHIIFSFPEDKDSTLFLCLSDTQTNHSTVWGQLKAEFGKDLILKDAGDYCTDEDEHFIRKYTSETLSDKITPEECFATRTQISNMNIGIKILE